MSFPGPLTSNGPYVDRQGHQVDCRLSMVTLQMPEEEKKDMAE